MKQLKKFLQKRYRGINGNIELRCFHVIKGRKIFIRKWYHYNDIDKLVSDISYFNNQKEYNICLGAHSRYRRSARQKSGKDKDVREITALFVDFDPYELPDEVKDDVMKKIEEFRYKPSIVVNSGHGMHLYWQLKKPKLKRDVPDYRRYQKGLARCFGTDESISDYARVMRCPYTYNLKDVPDGGEPLKTDCQINTTSKGWMLRYDLSDFDFCLKLVDDKLDKEIGEIKTLVKKDVNIKKLYIPELVKKKIKKGTEKGKRSDLDFRVMLSLLKWGYDEDVIYSIFTNKDYGISSKFFDHPSPDAYLRHSIRKAYQSAHSHAKDMVEDVLINISTVVGKGEDKPAIKKRRISEFIYNVLKQKGIGSFYKVRIGGGTFNYYYFDNVVKEIMKLPEERLASSRLALFLGNKCGINPADNEFAFTINHLRQKCEQEGKIIEIHRTAYYDDKNHKLYINNFGGKVYRLDGGKTKLVPHGTDDIFFCSENAEQLNADLSDKCRGKLRKFITGRINTDKKCRMTHDEQVILLECYIYSLFFESILPDKIILCCIGDSGSGKTFIEESIGCLLSGKNFVESSFEKKDDFIVAAINKHYLVWGNLDEKKGWEQDIIGRMGTGLFSPKRKLYSDDDLYEGEAKCFFAINARTPQFKWEDVADRLLIFYLEKVSDEERKGKKEMRNEILSNRGLIMGDILQSLNKIVEVFKEQDLRHESVIRMADFERLMRYIGVAISINVRPLLVKIIQTQEDFMFEDNPLVDAIKKLIKRLKKEERTDKWFNCSQLCNKPEFKEFKPQDLGIKMRQQWNLLKEAFVIEEKQEQNRWIYQFIDLKNIKSSGRIKEVSSRKKGSLKPVRTKRV